MAISAGAISHSRAGMVRRVAFLLHAIAACAWLYFMAGGFPLTHSRFLANRALPATVVVVAIAGIYAERANRRALLHAATACMAAAWLVASLTGIALFPISARAILPIGFVVAIALFRLRLDRAELRRRSRALTVAFVLVGVGIGFLVPFTQRAPLPTTHPVNAAMSAAPAQRADSVPQITMSKDLRVASADGTISFRRDRMLLVVYPLLTFVSRSPDRCWTLFAPRAAREWPERRLTHWSRDEAGIKLRYADLGITDLSVSAAGEDVLEMDAGSQILEPVYSHLNTYCEISLIGHTRLSLVFSPCPDKPINVLPTDYPVGRPARFAYLDAAGIFHVVEASSGEKGPFHELASGKLPRDQALEITFLDTNRSIGSVVLADWSAQVSTDLSPTAGWGVPQNSIEFWLGGDNPRSNASLSISLACTSVGRGFDSVGHASGVYRNRMSVRLSPP
jgi:hypothetical protein